MIEAIDAQEFTRTLTGFEEVAIKRLFSVASQRPGGKP
jgi:hypothetical protein